MATDETVSTIAKALGENEDTPLSQIAGVVRALGEETARTLLDETKDIEAKGGLMLPDNSRKRSPGGVFFFLARQKLSRDDKLAIFRPPKDPKAPASTPQSQSQSESSPFPRRRVIEVAPSSRTPQSRPPRAGFLPPDLPDAVRRVRAREGVLNSVAGLPRETQYELLLEVIAELHDQLGYRVPEGPRAPPRSAAAFDPPTRPGAQIIETPPSQRPIPVVVPESSRRASERPGAGPDSKADLPTPTRRASSAGTRSTTTTKRR
jgi:hypothetical protein